LVKSLFFFHLGTLSPPVRALGCSPGVGPPFRPDQKVKLDKTEAGRGGLSLRDGFLDYDEDGRTSTLQQVNCHYRMACGWKSVMHGPGVCDENRGGQILGGGRGNPRRWNAPARTPVSSPIRPAPKWSMYLWPRLVDNGPDRGGHGGSHGPFLLGDFRNHASVERARGLD
jgi:hypothetical protein